MRKEEVESQLKAVAQSIRPETAASLLNKLSGKREDVAEAVRLFYKAVIRPLDLPGPDIVLDPALERAAVHVAVSFYDLLIGFLEAKSLEVKDGD